MSTNLHVGGDKPPGWEEMNKKAMESFKKTSSNPFIGKTVFIAGGSGTWGNELTTQLLEAGVKEVRIFSRGEISQVGMKYKFLTKPVKFLIGDVRDYEAVFFAMKGSDYVFNLAALKHVGICEEQPHEAVKTNIDGTINLIRASIALKIYKFVFASTDKSVFPGNLYGMTKGVCERLVIQANIMTKNTDFICIRSGNILGSSGSVVPLLINMVKEKNKATVTDSRMTRFFLPVAKVAKLMCIAAVYGHGGEIFLPNVPSFYIGVLVRIITEHYGDGSTEIIETGARPGEKMYEDLISELEVGNTYESDYYFVMLPMTDVKRDFSHITDKLKKVDFPNLSSDTNMGSKKLLYKMMDDSGFLK